MPGVATAVPALGRVQELVFPFDVGDSTGAPKIGDQAVALGIHIWRDVMGNLSSRMTESDGSIKGDRA
jgi:hypothetical protein